MPLKGVWNGLRRKPKPSVASPEPKASTTSTLVAHELSLWEQAYQKLREDDPTLVKKYENQVQLILTNHLALTNKEQLNQIIAFGLRRIEEEKSRFMLQENLAKAAHAVEWAKKWIDQAVQASPQASIAWSIISLGIPFLSYPAAAEKDCIEGFNYTVSRMDYYLAVESRIMDLGAYNTSAIVSFYKTVLKYQISSVLRFYRTSSRTFGRDLLQLEDWKEMLKTLKTAEEQLYRNTLQTSSLMIHEHLLKLLKTVELNNEKMSLLTHANQEQLDVQKDIRDNIMKNLINFKENPEEFTAAERKDFLQQLRLVDSQLGPDHSYEMYKKRNSLRVEGTCLWFTNHPYFQEWMSKDFGPLFVTADPGCGKSVLAAYLIDNVLTKPVCYFFFKDMIKNRAYQALCALLHQIFSLQPKLMDYAQPFWESNGQGLMTNSVLLWKLFCRVINYFGPATIVLDGLDECKEEDRTVLLSDLVEYLHEPKAKFLFTSRPYGQITGKFQSLVEEYPSIRIPGESLSHEISPEIDIVIKIRVNQLAEELQLQSHIKNHIQAHLLAVPQRTYLWVYLVLNYLKNDFKRTLDGVDRLLRQLPTSVNNAYESMLQKCGPPSEHAPARTIFEILLAAKNTLRLDQLQVAFEMRRSPDARNIVDIDIEDAESFTRTLRRECGLMVSVLDNQVYFLHQTVREFLIGSTNDKTKWYGSFDIASCKNSLASICIDYISLDRIPVYSEETSTESDIDDSIDSDELHVSGALITSRLKFLPSVLKMAIISFDEYAESFWKEHYAEYKNDSQSPSLLDYKALKLYDTFRSMPSSWNRYRGKYGRGDTVLFNGTTDLMMVIQDEVIRLVPLCLEYTDINASSPLLGTALHEALWNESTIMIQMLLDAGASVDIPHPMTKETAVHFAAVFADNVVAKQIIEKSVKLDARDVNGRTPLHIAAQRLRPEIVSLLLNHGAKVNSAEGNGATLLHVVMEYCMDLDWLADVETIVDECGQYGADVNLTDSKGRTVLHSLLHEIWLWVDLVDLHSIPQPIFTRINTVVRKLIAAGADLEIRDNESQCVEDWGRMIGNKISQASLELQQLLDSLNQENCTKELGRRKSSRLHA